MPTLDVHEPPLKEVRLTKSMISEIYNAYGSLIETTYVRRDAIFDLLWMTTINAELGPSGKFENTSSLQEANHD